MNTKLQSVIESVGAAAGAFTATLERSRLNFKVVEEDVMSSSGVKLPRMKMLLRDDDKTPLGVVGRNYSPTDPVEFLQSQFELAEQIGGKVTRAGFIPDRNRAFAFIRTEQDIVLPRNLRKAGDPVGVYVYSIDGWDGGTPRKSRLYLERLVCANGMVSRQLQSSLWVSHTKNRQTRYEARAKDFIATTKTAIGEFTDRFVALAKQRMDQDALNAFLAQLFPGEGQRVEDRRQKVAELFRSGAGNEGRTRYDAFNAVTQYVTHDRDYRATDRTEVNVNRFLGVVEKNRINGQALELLSA
jgi:hypothetical protein